MVGLVNPVWDVDYWNSYQLDQEFQSSLKKFKYWKPFWIRNNLITRQMTQNVFRTSQKWNRNISSANTNTTRAYLILIIGSNFKEKVLTFLQIFSHILLSFNKSWYLAQQQTRTFCVGCNFQSKIFFDSSVVARIYTYVHHCLFLTGCRSSGWVLGGI